MQSTKKKVKFFTAELEPRKTADFSPSYIRVFKIKDRLYTAGLRTPLFTL